MALLLLAALLAWLALRGPRVDAQELRYAPLVRTLQFSARVATLSRVDIGSTLTGRVAQVLVTEGAQVRQGEVLIRLESDDAQMAPGRLPVGLQPSAGTDVDQGKRHGFKVPVSSFTEEDVATAHLLSSLVLLAFSRMARQSGTKARASCHFAPGGHAPEPGLRPPSGRSPAGV